MNEYCNPLDQFSQGKNPSASLGDIDQEKEELIFLRQLLTAANFKEDPQNYEEIKIERNKQLLFSFRVRPLEEEELQECRKKATQYGINPQNRNLSMEVGIDVVKLRSYKIYLATIEEDREKIWNNKALQEKIGILQGVDAVDKLLLAGEKDRVCNIIDEISGFQVSLEEYAKN